MLWLTWVIFSSEVSLADGPGADPTAVPAPEAPVPPPTPARLVAGPDAGWTAAPSAEDASKLVSVVLRCMMNSTPNKHDLHLYMPSYEADGVTPLLDAAIGWTPTRFEQHHSKLQATGTGCLRTTKSVTDTLATARSAVVVVPAGVALPEGWIVLWEAPHAP